MAGPRRSRSATSAGASRPPMAARCCAIRGCRAGAPTCATARPRSRCTWCGGFYVASPPAKARLFVAMDLPEPARAELAAWREEALGGRDELRLVDAAA